MWYHLLTALVLEVLYTYVTVFVCIIPWLGYDTLPGIIVLTAYITSLVLFCISYLRAIFTDPGPVPAVWKNPPYFPDEQYDYPEPQGAGEESRAKAYEEDKGRERGTGREDRERERERYDNERRRDSGSDTEEGDFVSNRRSSEERRQASSGGGGGGGNGSNYTALEDMPLLHPGEQDKPDKSYTTPQEGTAEPDSWPFCKVCKIYKPYRTHHCKMCNRCTLKMDHHCKWISNCVGFNNHKFFIQALYLGEAGCIFILAMAVLRPIFEPFDLSGIIDRPHDLIDFILYVCSSISVALQVFSLGGMVLFHSYLISHNMTHIEFNCCRGKAPGCRFDRGVFRNLQDVFGENILLWVLPIRVTPPELTGDGFLPVVDPEGGAPAAEEIDREKQWRVDKLMTGCCQCFT